MASEPYSDVPFTPLTSGEHYSDMMRQTSLTGSYDPDFAYEGLSGTSTLRIQIINSRLFAQATELFTADHQYGNIYLTELKAIPEKYSIPDRTFWSGVAESWGVTSKFEENLVNGFNSAMAEIDQLIKSFFTFKNTLPKEQVSQMADAGYNSALTGEGLEPSSMPSSSGSTSGSAFGSSSGSLSGFGTAALDGFISFIGSVASLFGGAGSLVSAGASAVGAVTNRMLAEDQITRAGDPNVQGGLATEKNKLLASQIKSYNDALSKDYKLTFGEQDFDDEGKPFVSVTQMTVKGYEILSQMAEFDISQKLAFASRSSIQENIRNANAGILTELEVMAESSGAISDRNEADFNANYFKARDGFSEGASQTSLAGHLANKAGAESALAQLDQWIKQEQVDILYDWGQRLSSEPYLSPFVYKALFGFPMNDTVWHQSPGMQVLRYTLDSGNDVAELLKAFLAGRSGRPKPTIRSTSTKTRTVDGNGSFTEIVETVSGPE